MKIKQSNDRLMTEILGWSRLRNYFCACNADANKMDSHYFKNIDNFFVAGINYKKSDASVRGLFAVGSDQYTAILEAAATEGIGELFVLSTCNRTEIYGIAHCPHQLVRLLCSQTAGD